MALFLNSAPMPAQDAIARAKRPQYGKTQDPLEGQITTAWLEWFTRLSTVVDQGPSVISTVSLNSQAASIAATDIFSGALSAGLYRITYYIRVTRAATVSSSLQISFAWTDGGVPQAAAGVALIGNTTQSWQSESIMVDNDAASPIQYATTYATAGATAMLYKVRVKLERM